MSSCSTTRDNFFSRTYHQTTAKYNGYFNANESVKLGIRKIKSAHKENYQFIIPSDKINRTEIDGQVFPNMDRAIEKTTKVITRHSMDISNKEKNKWIDDNYFLMARARFYKKEYLASLNTFKYIIRSYPKGNLVNQSLIWSAKCDIRLDNLQTAKKTLQYLLEEKQLTQKEQTDLYLSLSEINIKENKYKESVSFLEKAQKTNKNREIKPRIHFVLAQLYERLQKGDKALENYNMVIKSSPEYEMSFRASLNKANSYGFSSGNSQGLLKEYYKMLKDVKNIDYRDQIYYAIGEIKLNDQDTLAAINNYQNSLNSFLFNINQKLQTHFKLAQIYLQQKAYKPAYTQHDSIMMLMDIEDERYLSTKKRHRDLKDVVYNQDVIYEKDSLLALALLSEDERIEKINDYIENLKQEDMEAKSDSRDDDQVNFNLYEYNRSQANVPVGGGWYFYNPTAISFGYSEFLTRWGNRKNENNWRRKNKNQLELEESEQQIIEEGPSLKEKYNRDYYLSKIPLTPEQQDSTLRQIEKAYYNLGAHLKNNFFDYNQSIDTYEEMLERFDKSEYKLLVYMQLVFLYDIVEEIEAKREILKSIQNEFPKNKYINSQTGELLLLDSDNVESDYELIYNLYVNKKYNEAMNLITQSLKEAPSDSLNIKMIQAFCISRLKGKKEFIIALEKIKKQNPKTIQGKKSTELLDVLYGSFYEKEEDLYRMDPESEHHMIITVSDLKVDIPKLQGMLSRYNNKNFSEQKLEIKNLLLNKQTQIIKITNFSNRKSAQSYYESTFNDSEWTELYAQEGIDKMIVSKPNFINLLKEKSIEDYKIYFQEKYLN